MTKFWKNSIQKLQDLVNSDSRPIKMLMSGGTQSLLLAKLLLEAQVSFEAKVFSYADRNLFDIQYAVDFCKTAKIPFEVLQFDVASFLSSELTTYSQELGFMDPVINIQCRLADTFNTDSVVLAGLLFPEITFENARKQFLYNALDFGQIPIKHSNLFFFQSQSIVEDLLLHPAVLRWLELQPKIGFESTKNWRETIIRFDWKDFKSNIPWTGLEGFGDILSEAKKSIMTHSQTRFPVFEKKILD